MLTNDQFIIRTHYLTPYKITLLILITKFCQFDFPADVIPKMVVFLLDSIQTNKDAHNEPDLNEAIAAISAFDIPMGTEELVYSIHEKLQEIETPDKLFVFMTALVDVVAERDDESDMAELTAVNKNSVFGVFVRRCRLAFQRSTFQQKSNLFAMFRAYVAGTAHDKLMHRDAIVDKNANQSADNEQHVQMDPFQLDENYRLDGWLSDCHIDRFLTSQAEKIDKTGTSDIPPSLLHNHLNYLQKHFPDMGKLYQVRFLNYIRTGEYEGALTNLHRFFDYCLLNREVPMYQYALLNLGVLNVKFGHMLQAASALNEAVHVASENKDEECLNQVMSWLQYIQERTSDNMDTNIVYMASDENTETDNVVYLQSLDKLSRARQMLIKGEPAVRVFATVYKSIIQGSLANIDYLAKPQNIMKAHLWRFYGNAVLSDLYLNMALSTVEGTTDDNEKAIILAADVYAGTGELAKAYDLLKDFGRKYPDLSAKSLRWKQAMAKLLHRFRSTSRVKHVSIDQTELLALSDPCDLDQYYDALYELAMEANDHDDPDSARMILQQSCQELKKTERYSHLARALNALAQLYMDQGGYDEAIELLQESLVLTKRAHDAINQYAAIIKLVDACLGQDDEVPLDSAVRMIETILPGILIVGSAELVADVSCVYAKVLIARALSQEACRDATLRTSLGYVKKAQDGFRQLGKNNEVRYMYLLESVVHEQLQDHEASSKALQQADEVQRVK